MLCNLDANGQLRWLYRLDLTITRGGFLRHSAQHSPHFSLIVWAAISTFGSSGYALTFVSQFKAAQFLRLAESKGNKTIGNTWYVQFLILNLIWTPKYPGTSRSLGRTISALFSRERERVQYPRAVHLISHVTLSASDNHHLPKPSRHGRQPHQKRAPKPKSTSIQPTTTINHLHTTRHPHPTSFNAHAPSSDHWPRAHLFAASFA